MIELPPRPYPPEVGPSQSQLINRMNPYAPPNPNASPTHERKPNAHWTLFVVPGLALVSTLSIASYLNFDWAIFGAPFTAALFALIPLSRLCGKRVVRICILGLFATVVTTLVCLLDYRSGQPVYRTIDFNTFANGLPWVALAGAVAAVLIEAAWGIVQLALPNRRTGHSTHRNPTSSTTPPEL